MKIFDYRDFITHIPENTHSFYCKRANWELCFDYDNGNMVQNIFSDNDIIQISRNDILQAGKSGDLKDLIIKALLWGYPSGGRGNNVKSILENISSLEGILNQAKEGKDGKWHKKSMQGIPGLGLSTYSKFLYFIGANIDLQKAVIFDKKIESILVQEIFEDFKSPCIKDGAFKRVEWKYTCYLKAINKLATDNNLPVEKIELFLFSFGLHLKNLDNK